METVSNIITTSKLALSLCLRDQAKNSIFKGGNLASNQPFLIAFFLKFLQYTYAYNPSNANISAVANYLQKLCGKYFLQASSQLASGGQIITINTGGTFNLSFAYVQGLVGTLMSAPYSTLVVEGTNVLSDSVSVHLDGVLVPRNISTQTNYTVSYSVSGFTITFSSVAYPDPSQLLEITYAQAVST